MRWDGLWLRFLGCGIESVERMDEIFFFFFEIVRADLSTDRSNLYDCFNLIRLMWLIMVRWIK